MKWSYSIARISGIDIKVHATFALTLAYRAFRCGFPNGSEGAAPPQAAVFGSGPTYPILNRLPQHVPAPTLAHPNPRLTVRELARPP